MSASLLVLRETYLVQIGVADITTYSTQRRQAYQTVAICAYPHQHMSQATQREDTPST